MPAASATSIDEEFSSHQTYVPGQVSEFTEQAKERIAGLAQNLAPMESECLMALAEFDVEMERNPSGKRTRELVNELTAKADGLRQEFDAYIPAIAEATGNSEQNIRLLLAPERRNRAHQNFNVMFPSGGTPASTLEQLLIPDAPGWEVPVSAPWAPQPNPYNIFVLANAGGLDRPNFGPATYIEGAAKASVLEALKNDQVAAKFGEQTSVWAKTGGEYQRIDSWDQVDWSVRSLLDQAKDAYRRTTIESTHKGPDAV
mgnify:CR=1 FL=1